MKVRNRYFLVLAVAWGPCLLVAAACYALILRPQLDCRKDLEANIASSKERYARAVEAAKEKDQSRLTGQVESLHRRIGDFVVSLEEAPDLSFKISELAKEAKLASFGMRPANKSGSDALPNFERIGEKRVALTFSAGFRRFAAFLNTLERHHPVLFVETFALSRPMDKDSEPQGNMELAVLVEKAAGPEGASK
jgi:hypothetical protein